MKFLQGRDEIVGFLTRKWNRELDYRLIKELWEFRENRVAVRLAYEWHDDSGNANIAGRSGAGPTITHPAAAR